MNTACYNPTRGQIEVPADYILFWPGLFEPDILGDHPAPGGFQRKSEAHPVQAIKEDRPELPSTCDSNGWRADQSGAIPLRPGRHASGRDHFRAFRAAG